MKLAIKIECLALVLEGTVQSLVSNTVMQRCNIKYENENLDIDMYLRMYRTLIQSRKIIKQR